MGKKDIITKNYIRRPEIFADIFNYRLYGGKDRIQPDQLKEMDIAESLVTNQKGNGGRFGKAVTVEKYRDIKKIFKEDKIIPVITVVLYFGEKPWDGPRSLKDMMGWKGEEAESYI